MPAVSLGDLTRRVTSYFRRTAGRYGLNAGTVEANYILNWGGFVNASFFIQDGRETYYLKLANGEPLTRLERWASVHQLLTGRYHAPRMLDWIMIPGTPYQGLLFEYISGQAADLAHQPEVLRGILDLLPKLHGDHNLMGTLFPQYKDNQGISTGQNYTCIDSFADVYLTRFEEDLFSIGSDLPPFVSLERLNWMKAEAGKVKSLAHSLPAFQHPADALIHGDLWPNNILVTDSGAWYIIDWDDLNLGDPALEYSILLGPLWRCGAITLADVERYLPTTIDTVTQDDFSVRFHFYARILLLDEIIDSLADWVESSVSTDHVAEVRAEKEQTHRKAIEDYRQWF